MATYVYEGDTPTYHPGLEMLLVPGENEVPEDKAELADQLPYLHRQGEMWTPPHAMDEPEADETGGQEPEA